MKKINKKIYLLVGGIIVVLTTILGFVLIKNNNSEETKEASFVSKELKNIGTDKFDIKELNEVSSTKIDENAYILNDKSFLTNMTDFHLAKDEEKKVYPEMAKKMQASVSEGLKNEKKLELVNQSKDAKTKKEVLTYEYSGPNLFMYQFDVNEISAMISQDMGKIVPMEQMKSSEESWTYMAMAVIRAMKIVEPHYDFYKKDDARKVTISLEEKDGKMLIEDAENVLTKLNGLSSKNVWGDSPDYYEKTFVPTAQKRAKEYYDEAIKNGTYNPEKPFAF